MREIFLRVTISNMAWLDKRDLSDTTIFMIKQKTTIIPKKTNYGDDIVRPIEMWRETETHLGIPRHYYRKNSDQKNVVTYEVSEGQPLPKNVQSIVLREYDQQPVMETVLTSLTCGPWGSGLLEAYTAFGKTVCAIDLICKLGGNALILVHSDALLMQWKERIKQFFPNAKIGTIQQKTCDYKGKDIVIGMVQSLMRSTEGKYPEEIFSYFRTMIIDEIHRMGSGEFGKVAPKFNPKYSLGMSGTIRRKDGCINVFKWVLGEIIVKADNKMRINPIIYVRYTPFRAVKKHWQVVNNKTGRLDDKSFDMNEFTKPTQLNFIAKSKERNKFIAEDIVRSLKSGRNPLVMGERLVIFDSLIELVTAMTKKDPFFTKTVSQGLYTGGKSKDTKKEELEAASRCDIVYATVQLAKEGIDIKRLDTLFLTTPLADVEQMVGRICRPKIIFEDGKPIIIKKSHDAMVVDYCDDELRSFEGLLVSRMKMYSRLNWKVIGLKEYDE